jgi:cell division septum initiation protein DivIVA
MRDTPFPVIKRGYEPKSVDAAMEDLRDRVAHAEATTHAARRYAASVFTELHRLQVLEDELTTALDLARQTADAVLADAHQRATEMVAGAEQQAGACLALSDFEANQTIADARRDAERALAEGRARLAAETAEMERYRLAIAAEATMLQQIEHRLGPRLSRAAARLIEVVDAPDGIGPFSHASAALVDFARLLQRSVAAGTYDSLALELDGGEAVLRLRSRAVDLRDGEPMVPIDQAKALNISSMALS